MESCPVLGVGNVFNNSFLQTSQPVKKNSDQVASISIFLNFKYTILV